MATFWITKYALTKGIYPENGCDISRHGDNEYATKGFLFAKIGKDAFRTEKEAKRDAVDRMRRKLRALDRHRERLIARLKEVSE